MNIHIIIMASQQLLFHGSESKGCRSRVYIFNIRTVVFSRSKTHIPVFLSLTFFFVTYQSFAGLVEDVIVLLL